MLFRRWCGVWLQVLTLALGVASTVVVAAVAHEFLYAGPAGVAEPDALFAVHVTEPPPGGDHGVVSYVEYEALRDRSASHIQLAASFALDGNARVGATATHARVAYVSTNYFEVLGTASSSGRTFGTSPDGADMPLAVVSERLAGRFGGTLLPGSTLVLNGTPTTVIGITPAAFTGVSVESADVWVPLRWFIEIGAAGYDRALMTDPGRRWLSVVGRPQDGISVPQAESSAAGIVGRRVRLTSARRFSPPTQEAAGQISRVLTGAVVLVLIIAVANTAGLVLVHHRRRQQDYAIRMALGCSRMRIVAARLGEGAAVGVIAGAVAVPIAHVLLLALIRFMVPSRMQPLFDGVAIDRLPIIAMTAAVGIGAGIAAAFVPTVRLARMISGRLLSQLRAGAAGNLSRPSRVLLALQTAMAVALLLMVSLLVQTRRAVLSIPAGFAAEGVWFATIDPTQVGYSAERAARLVDQLSERLAAMPEFAETTVARQVVMQGGGWAHRIADGPNGASGLVPYNVVAPNYFDFFAMPIRAGRGFTRSDTARAARVMVINETLAEDWGGSLRALGASVRLEGESEARTVVGIVPEVKYTRLQAPSRPYFYVPTAQSLPGAVSTVAMHARMRDPRATAEAPFKRIVGELDPNLAVQHGGSLESQFEAQVALPTLLAAFISAVSALALVLVCLGLHAALAQTIAYMHKEMAVRIALGSDHRALRVLLGRRLLTSVAAGVAVGWFVGAIGALVLRTQLVEASVFDPRESLTVVAVVGLCAAVGCGRQLYALPLMEPCRALRQS